MVPGRAFTRGMYSHLKLQDASGRQLKQHHHVWLNRQFLSDCQMWKTFLTGPQLNLCRPFVDFAPTGKTSVTLNLMSDASRAEHLGMGAIFLEEGRWIVDQWSEDFIKTDQPSIEYLELYALTAAVLTWSEVESMQNQRVTVFCDNESVVYMVNNSASTCEHCMKLIRIITLDNIKANRRLFVSHTSTGDNYLADALSRLNFKKFWRLAPPGVKPNPDRITDQLLQPQVLFRTQDDYLI